MEKKELSYDDFLNEVSPEYHAFVNQIHDNLLEKGCKLKIQTSKSGYVVSYSHPKSKRVIINFVFRKSGLVIRIYGDNVNKYIDFIHTMPDELLESIVKAPNCKRLINPDGCNSRCPMGYELTIGDVCYKKCRYNCFMFDITAENIPFISEFVENELKGRELG